MQDAITAYLIQAKECSLPGIGQFKIESHNASTDVANKSILPPYNEIVFQSHRDQEADFGLIKYLSEKLNIDKEEAKKKLKLFCISTSNHISRGETVVFPSLGSLQKDDKGTTYFTPNNNLNLLEPVIAERVIHENANHAVLVGDKETTSDKSVDYLIKKTPPEKQWWKIAALILFIIGLSIILFQFYNNGPLTGNQAPVIPNNTSPTYK